MKRRTLLRAGAGFAAVAASPVFAAARRRVVVVGGGYAGATAAKNIRVLSGYTVEVVLIEPAANFVSAPQSNLVIGGSRAMADITRPFTTLERRHGVTLVHDRVSAIDLATKTVRLAHAEPLRYDKLVLAPGVSFGFGDVEGLAAAHASGIALHAWNAGEETIALRRQLEAMPDGGVFAITIPELPYRCPPAPYERACQAAWYFKQAKPKSKVLILDANPDVASKAALFRAEWASTFAGIVEYRAQHTLSAIDAPARTLKFDVQDDVRADVINIIPPQSAGAIVRDAGLANEADKRWAGVDFQTFESTAARDVFVIGDSIQIASGMTRSAGMASSQGRVAAAAIVAQLGERAINAHPTLESACFSYIDDRRVMHLASRLRYDEGGYQIIDSSNVSSTRADARELPLAREWARRLWADVLA